MRIPCPYCGSRDLSEFAYHGDARPKRPDPSAENASELYLRIRLSCGKTRPGRSRSSGTTRADAARWLTVTRDTRTHAVAGA